MNDHEAERMAALREAVTKAFMETTYRAGDPWTPDTVAFLAVGNGRYTSLKAATEEDWQRAGIEPPDEWREYQKARDRDDDDDEQT